MTSDARCGPVEVVRRAGVAPRGGGHRACHAQLAERSRHQLAELVTERVVTRRARAQQRRLPGDVAHAHGHAGERVDVRRERHALRGTEAHAQQPHETVA